MSDDGFGDDSEDDSVDEVSPIDASPAMRIVAVLVGLILIGIVIYLYYIGKFDHEGVVSFLLGAAGVAAISKGIGKDLGGWWVWW
jgi:hypothetical protein